MVQQIARVHQNRLIAFNKEVKEELGITNGSFIRITCVDGMAELEVVDVKTVVKPRKKKKVDQHEK